MTAISAAATTVDRARPPTPALSSSRERLLQTAYALFTRYGTRTVGIDTVIAEAGVAKATLYRHFASKDELILAFLARREQLWSSQWLAAEVTRRGATPAQRLLAVFDAFGEWFTRADFEGCPFVTTMLEVSDGHHPVRRASVAHLAILRGLLRDWAAAAGIEDADGLSHQWHLLMNGAIIAAEAGDTHAAERARQLGLLLLRHHHVEPEPARTPSSQQAGVASGLAPAQHRAQLVE